MTASSDQFDLAVSYWPASAAMFWWEHFDLEEVALDLDAASALGLLHLSIGLVWDDFQPDRERVDVQAMRRLERVLDAAFDRSMALSVTLFPAEIERLLRLPTWTLQVGTQGGRPILSGETLNTRQPYNLFQNESVVQAEVRLASEIVGSFADHPAIAGWTLGSGLGAASQPSSPDAFEEWLGTMAEAARQAGARQPLAHSISSRDLVLSPTIDPASVARADMQLEVACVWQPPWAETCEARWAAFLCGYAARLGAGPALLSNLGSCTRPATVSGPCLDESEAAEQMERTLRAAQTVGARGCRAAALLDYDTALARTPVFRDDPSGLTRGLLRGDRLSKETVEPWVEAARRHCPVAPLPADFPPADPEERRRDPEGVALRCYRQLGDGDF